MISISVRSDICFTMKILVGIFYTQIQQKQTIFKFTINYKRHYRILNKKTALHQLTNLFGRNGGNNLDYFLMYVVYNYVMQ